MKTESKFEFFNKRASFLNVQHTSIVSLCGGSMIWIFVILFRDQD